MSCSGGGGTLSPADSDPLGFSVNARSGAITGTPERVRDGYRMQLRAVDADDVRTPVADWSFDVKAPNTFSLKEGRRPESAADGLVSTKYLVATTHLLPSPRFSKEELLQVVPHNALVCVLAVELRDRVSLVQGAVCVWPRCRQLLPLPALLVPAVLHLHDGASGPHNPPPPPPLAHALLPTYDA